MSGEVTVAVANPVTMNVQTATIDRLLRRAMPQMPCPEVHPFPRRVPKPDKNPAIKYP